MLDAISLVDPRAALGFPFQDQPFGSSVAKVVAVEDVHACETAEVEGLPGHWLNATEEVGLREIGNLLKASDMVKTWALRVGSWRSN